MSSVQRQGVVQSETSTKKKFGKNLNKLTKPPAPPITSSSTSARGQGAASSRNGLLLLSTKRSNTVASGLLASKPTAALASSRSLQPLGLKSESYTSAHDALLGAVIGASRTSDVQQPPDAWGVAEKQSSETPVENYKAPTLAPKGGISSYQAGDVRLLDTSEMPHSTDSLRTDFMVKADAARQTSDTDHPARIPVGYDIESYNDTRKSHSNNHYSGDSRSQPLEQVPGENGDAQVTFMSKLARERAEKRRTEEKARENDQKERASQRLKELEEKMLIENHDEIGDFPGPPATAALSNIAQDDTDSQPIKSHVVLEPLGRAKAANGVERNADVGRSVSSGDRVRTLFDPNRTFSSLVGGIPIHGSENDDAVIERETLPSHNSSANVTAPNLQTAQSMHSNPTNEPSSSPLIHLTSYEDRDRGERNNNAGPRMLFDPKSGSMVAVPSRDDIASGARGKKGAKPKGRSSRDPKERDNVTADHLKSETESQRDGTLAKLKKLKGRKDDTTMLRRKGSDATDNPSKEEMKSVRTRGGKARTESRLPRTCGVLYVKDENGNCYCADGCDGDQGYGSHSVPGGRLRNPDAYIKFMEEQQRYQRDQNRTPIKGSDVDYGVEGYDDDNGYYRGRSTSREGTATIHTGLIGMERPVSIREQNIDWVKPNERIELVTGVDDSPTLQATANPWAPSEAALAAAAAAKKCLASETKPQTSLASDTDKVHEMDEESDMDDSHPAFIGLGFDPTENMDSVMRSPSLMADSSDRFESVDLAALALDAPRSNQPTSKNIFAFGSSPTWGATSIGSTQILSNWAMLGTGHGNSMVPANEGQEPSILPASFLSLSSSNTWGSGGLSGLGASMSTGEHTGSKPGG